MEIEILRHAKNVWGQKMLVGVSWDLLWVPFAAALLFILLHLVFRQVKRQRNKTREHINQPEPTETE